MDKSLIKFNVNTELILNDKCAEVIRDIASGTYSFQCYHCGQLLQADSSDSSNCADIFKHLDAHYYVSEQEEEEEEEEEEGEKEDDDDDTEQYLQTEFLDIEFLNNDSGVTEYISEETTTKTEETEENADPGEIRETEETSDTDSKIEILENEEEATNFECNVCQQKFVRQYAYMLHCKTHTNQSKEVEQNNLKIEIIQEFAKFMCTICSTVFTSKGHLTNHNRRLHRDIYNFDNYPELKCDVCSKTFINNYELKRHITTKHFPSKKVIVTSFTCDICGISSPFKYVLKEHMQIHINNNENSQFSGQKKINETNKLPKVVCSLCGRSYKNITILKEHHQIKHKGTLWVENESEIKNKKSSLKNNTDSAATNEQPVCYICGKMYKTKRILTDHLRLRHADELGRCPLHNCTLCDKKFYKQIYLNAHMEKIHSEQDHPEKGPTSLLKCEICDQTFVLQKTLINHLRRYHDTCQSCGNVYKNKSSLIAHYKESHSGEYLESMAVQVPNKKNHKCEICGKEFSLRGNLNIHVRIHTGEKPYSCTFCDKRFVQQQDMKTHVRRKHTGDLPFQCEICGRKFVKLYLLKEHKKRHFGDKPFECQYCRAPFFSNHLKKLHERKHTGIKPYTCDVCQRTYRTSNTLKQHKMLHTGEKRYACRYCDLKFAQYAGRSSHEKNVHGSSVI